MWTKPSSSVMAHRVPYLTNWTQHEPKCNSRPEPAIFQNTTSALKVEHMSAVQLGWEKKKKKKKQELNIRTIISDPFALKGHILSYWVTCTAGAAERASVKQIIHMSSASCFRQPVLLSQPCKHGRQLSSFLTPPQGCPQGWVLLQACFAYSWKRTKRDSPHNTVLLQVSVLILSVWATFEPHFVPY